MTIYEKRHNLCLHLQTTSVNCFGLQGIMADFQQAFFTFTFPNFKLYIFITVGIVYVYVYMLPVLIVLALKA